MTLPLATALRGRWAAGYAADDLKADVLAGVVVGVVALPLSMALAIASGVAPQHGLYTAAVAGLLIALLGGSRFQVSGPTAAFVVVLSPIAARFGLGGLLLAGALAGVMLIAMGASGLGHLIQFVPYPVTTGFTAGIAVVIATLQLRDVLGLSLARLPEHFPERVAALVSSLPSARWQDALIAAVSLGLILATPRWSPRTPPALVGLLGGTLLALALGRALPGFDVSTIDTRFTYTRGGEILAGIPRDLPRLAWPWALPGADGEPLRLSFGLVRELLPSAFAIAVLGAIESLLSAVVADGMTRTRHDPDAELLAQGVGNLIAPAFGGIAATGAIARTATNIRAGARSPIAAAVHAMVVLASVLVLAPWLGYLPMASLAALLLVVAWNMSEHRHVTHLIRVAPRADVAVLLTCFGLTVVFDMVVAVTAGILLAALLFMKRMAEVSGARLVGPGHPELAALDLPRGVLLYDIAGPLFFGAAQKAMAALRDADRREWKAVVLDLEDVPAIDATGLVALEELIRELHDAGVQVILAGVTGQVLRAIARTGWRGRRLGVRVFGTVERGLEEARRAVQSEAG